MYLLVNKHFGEFWKQNATIHIWNASENSYNKFSRGKMYPEAGKHLKAWRLSGHVIKCEEHFVWTVLNMEVEGWRPRIMNNGHTVDLDQISIWAENRPDINMGRKCKR